MTAVLLISPLCSREVYRRSVPEELRTGQAMQKFSGLLARGLVQNGASVHVLSAPPVARGNDRWVFIPEPDEEGGVGYHYLPTLRPHALGRVVRMVETIRRTLNAASRYADVVLADPMNVLSFLSARVATRICRTPLVGVVTDVPTYYAGSVGKKKSFALRASEFLMVRADAYVLLTPQMSGLVNPRHRPAVIVEGMAEVGQEGQRASIGQESRVMLYAGGIRKAYGLERLLAAFARLSDPVWEFHIYGGGDFAGEFASLCKNVPNVKYMGVKDNAEVIEAQKQASLLVNPRLSDHEYTKYSFPSKIIEYLVSGTPALTTRLPGIPHDYLPHLLFFDDESEDGMRRTLARIYSMPDGQRRAIGERARNWAGQTKSAQAQCQSVLEMLNNLVDVSGPPGH